MEFGRFAPRSRRGVDVRHWDVEMSVSRSAIDGIFLCEDCRNESMNALYPTMDCYEIDEMSNISDLQYKRPKERTILTASSFLYNMRFVRSAPGIRSTFYLSLLDI